MAHARTLFLAGAPDAKILDWSDKALTTSFTSPTKRYLHIDHDFSGTPSTRPQSNWRAVSLDDKLFYESQAVSNKQGKEPARDSGTQFLEAGSLDRDYALIAHSLAVYTNTQYTQHAPESPGSEDEESTFITENNTFLSTMFEDSTILLGDESFLNATELLPSPSVNPNIYHHFAGQITNIRAIPNAEYLARLQPQTMTVNLIAGVISIAPARTVKVRRGNYDMNILEITLGDETKAGFTISSWHTPLDSEKQNDSDPLRQTLMSLRPQDIVLVEQIALTSFRGLVFGQSLNRKVSKSATKVTVVCKADALRRIDEDEDHQAMLSAHVAGKLQRTKDWVTSFVGPSKKRQVQHSDRARSARKRQVRDEDQGEEQLPPDSSAE